MERFKQSWASVKGQTQAVCSRNITGEEEKAEAIDKILPNLSGDLYKLISKICIFKVMARPPL
jgi:hypothetical protein